ncbi:carbamoyltransferase HypF [Gaetbulibacter sp. M235]|uniref:carbamoyltransferase HypF n=1 Tax=Gaetbulibacter sp. M235 TaxID=3126510 RepID=UPI00374F7DCD
MLKTYKILISGQVQGVGFRPYVYNLANEFSLKGSVSNDENGVIILVQGSKQSINNFCDKLIKFPPPVSKIKNHSVYQIQHIEFDTFKIAPSKKVAQLDLLLTPDFAICDDCKQEIKDINNKRFNYPFTTCVNCGPRWAITETFPFERSNTSVDDFVMCEECQEEYENPSNRRFHSQTNTCSTCGINFNLTDNQGQVLNLEKREFFKKNAQFLSEGKIIAIKNTSGFLLCCNAENGDVVKKLRLKKQRPNKPFAVLYPSINSLKSELKINAEQEKSLTSVERPINIINLNDYKGNIALNEVTPGLKQLGVMLPYSGILQLLANELKFPIVATSGNIHGSPIISEFEDALLKLNKVADYFLNHNLRIVHPQDDSVVKFSNKFNVEVLFRRSRGFAPNLFDTSIKSDKKIMALGAHLKSTIAYVPNSYVYLSQYLGNLDNYDVYNRFTHVVQNFIDVFEKLPEVLLVDSHLGYQSTIYGDELSKENHFELHKIQHHKAHFASVLAEHNLFDINEPVLGVIWDGTGYGDDKQIWGGEFFEYSSNNIERITHFEYFDWLAGDKMSKEPKLSLFSLSSSEMEKTLNDKFKEHEILIYQKLKSKNKLKTSSVGRLFDAVASLLDICDYNTYEGEAAILLENYITNYNLSDCYSYCKVVKNGTIPTKELIWNLFLDYKKGNSMERVIVNFFYTLSTIIFQIAQNYNFKHIAFSGGVFQNTTLIDMIKEIGEMEYKLYFNINLAPNDENISFGQIMYYLKCNNK